MVVPSSSLGLQGAHMLRRLMQGSTQGRAATEKEKARGANKCVFKDLDMMERVRERGKLHFGTKRRDFLQQIERDVAVRAH